MMIQQGRTLWVVHYLDFFTLNPSKSPICANNMEVMATVCSKAGLPVEPSKTVGPSTKGGILKQHAGSVCYCPY